MLPQPTDPFAWVQAASGPGLVCRALEPFARHVFTSRPWPLGSARDGDSPRAWLDVAAAIGVDAAQLARIHQVHGAHAVVVDGRSVLSRPDADIIVSDDPNIGLAIQTADCVPLLIADTRTGAVAAAHAGWRGLAARVPRIAIDILSRQYGSRPGDLIAAAGPSIGACCYEVGEDVYEKFRAAGFRDDELARLFLLDPQPTRRNPSMGGLPPIRREQHWYFDGWAATRDALVAAGVPAARIHIAELCTASHRELCSYRRDGKPAGRMAAAVRSVQLRP